MKSWYPAAHPAVLLIACLLAALALHPAAAQEARDSGASRPGAAPRGGTELVPSSGPLGSLPAPATQDFSTLGTFTLPAGGSITLQFDAMVNASVPAGTQFVINQGVVAFDQVAFPVPSDDPTTGAADDPTVTLLLVEAELGVTKSDNPASGTAVPGNAIQYDVVVSNAGPFGVNDIPVTDTFPAALGNCSWSCGGTGNCDTANGTGDVATTVDLEAGQSVTFAITCDVDPAATGSLVNTASATAPAGVSDPGNTANSDDDVNTLTPQGDLSISKVTNTMPVVPGGAIQYGITVANSGPSDAVGADVTDTFPAAVTGVTWSCAGAGGATCPAANGAGDLAETVDLPAGGSLTYTVDGTVDAGAAGSIDNTATLTVPAGFTDTVDADAVAGSESDTVTDTLDPEGDVAVAKTTLTSPVVPGAAVQYQIQVTNAGPSDADGVTLTDTFPAAVSGVTWTCAASAGSACSAASGNGDLGESVDVAAGGSVTYTATGTVSAAASGDLVNTAVVTPPAGFADGTTGNDDSTVTDTLEPQGDLSVTKTTLTSPVVAGLPVEYEVTVSNAGPSTATGAQVQDNFDADLGNESWTCVASGGATCTAAGNGDILDAVTLPAGGSVTYSVTADLAADATGPLGNTATVTPPAGFTDTNGANDSDTVSNAVAQQADLVVSKTTGGGVVLPGGPISFVIVVSNQGPGDATGVTVTDVFPAELSDVEWTCVAAGGATCTAGPVSGDINDSADVPAGGSVTYTATATAPDLPGPITNTASATLAAGAVDPTPEDAESSVTANVGSVLDIPTLSEVGLALLVLLLAGLGLWRLRRRGAVIALALLLVLGAAGAVDAQVLVDDFSTAQGPNEDPPGGPPPASSTADTGGADILGGERDLEMRLISGSGPVTGEVTGGAFELAVPASDRGEATLTWDGNDDDATTLDPVGLGGVDLTAGGTLSGFRLTVDQASEGIELILRVFTDGSNHSQAGRYVSAAINSATSVFVPFDELRTVAGAGADPADVGAVVLVARGEDGDTLQLARLETLGPDLVVTKVDLDPNTDTELGNTPVSAGSTIRYRIQIQNQGGAATTVDVNDAVDPNTTLLSNTLDSTPVAVGDAYRWFGNVTLNVDGATLPTLLANDTDPDGDPITITASDATSARGGAVTLNDASTGTFTYVPPAGLRGIDSFTYTVQDDDGNSSTATATIQLEQVVWFVDSGDCSPAPCGVGTQAAPFSDLAQAEAASGPGDVIRLRQGSDDAEELARHNAGIVLQAGQKLVGEGVDLLLSGVHIEGLGTADGNLDPNASNRPRITHAGGGNGLTLADNAEILGLDVVGSDDAAVFGSTVSDVTLDHVTVIDSGGAALEIANGTNLSLDFDGLDSLNSSGHGVHLDTVTGTLSVTGTTQLDDPAQSGIRIESSPGLTATFAAVNVVDAGGGAPHAALHLEGNAGATFTFGTLSLDSANGDGFFALNGGTVNHPSSGNTVNAVGGAALDLQSTTGNAGGSAGWSFDSLASASSPDHGVRLVALTGDVTVGAGGTTVTDPDTVGIVVQGAAAGTAYDFGATSVTDTNVGAGATGNGIDLSAGNSTATFTFDSLDVVTDGGYGLLTNNTDTLTVTATSGNQIVATGGAALDVTSTGIGGSGLVFDTLTSMNSPAFGVNLIGLTAGTITGNAGTISNSGSTSFRVIGGAPVVTYSGSVAQSNAQRVVDVQNTSGGSVTFDTGTVTGAASSTGVNIGNADGNVSFADLDLGTSGTPLPNQAITLGGGSTGTFTFAGTQVFTTGANGVHATNGGVVEFTGAGNRVSATNGRAVTFEGGTTIGPNGVTFERLDASGTDHGVRLDNAGAGFTVTGDGANGTDGSGGVLANMTQRAVEAIQTSTLTLRNVDINNGATTNGADPTDPSSNCGALETGSNVDCHAAVHLQSLSDVVLDNVDIDGTVQHGVNGRNVTNLRLENSRIENAGNQVRENGLNLHNTAGTLVLLDSVIDFPEDHGARIFNDSGVLNMTMRRTTVSNNKGVNGNDGINMEIDGGTTTVLVDDSDFTQLSRDGFDGVAETNSGAVLNVTVLGSRFNNSDGFGGVILASAGDATLFTRIENNVFQDNISNAINLFAAVDSRLDATVTDNTISHPNVNNIGFGIRVIGEEDSDVNVLIDNATIADVAQGILLRSRSVSGTQAGTLDATVVGSSVTNSDIGIQVASGTSTGTHNNVVCFNTSTASGGGNNNITGTSGLDWLLEQNSTTTFNVEDLGATAIVTFVQNNNVGTPAVFTTGTFSDAPSACDTPAATPTPPAI